MNKIHLSDFQHFLTDDVVKPLKLIYLAIGAGVSFFLLVVLYHFHNGPPTETGGGGFNLLNLSLFHAVFLVGGLWSSNFMYARRFREKQARSIVGRSGSSETDPSDVVAVIRTARTMKLAMLEGPAFFGLTVCFIGVTGGAIYREPLYWINLLSYGILMSVVYRDFPTRDRILFEARNRLGYLFM